MLELVTRNDQIEFRQHEPSEVARDGGWRRGETLLMARLSGLKFQGIEHHAFRDCPNSKIDMPVAGEFINGGNTVALASEVFRTDGRCGIGGRVGPAPKTWQKIVEPNPSDCASPHRDMQGITLGSAKRDVLAKLNSFAAGKKPLAAFGMGLNACTGPVTCEGTVCRTCLSEADNLAVVFTEFGEPTRVLAINHLFTTDLPRIAILEQIKRSYCFGGWYTVRETTEGTVFDLSDETRRVLVRSQFDAVTVTLRARDIERQEEDFRKKSKEERKPYAPRP